MLDPETEKYGALLAGSRILIQDAGPERFRSGFDRAMLELQRAPFVSLVAVKVILALVTIREFNIFPPRIR